MIRSRGRALLAVSWLLFSAAGCSVFTTCDSDTPERAFQRLRTALVARDWAAVYEVAVSPTTDRIFNEDLRKTRESLIASGGAEMMARSILGVSAEEYVAMDAKRFFAVGSQRAGEKSKLLLMIPSPEDVEGAEVLGVEQEGDQAELRVQLRSGLRPLSLNREGGRWYFEVMNPM